MAMNLWRAGVLAAGGLGVALGCSLWAADPKPKAKPPVAPAAAADDDGPADDAAATDPVAKIALAGRLTEYGRQAKSPASLIDAAAILRSIGDPVQDKTAKPETTGADGKPAAAEPGDGATTLEAQSDGLLKEAKSLAKTLTTTKGPDGKFLLDPTVGAAAVVLADAVLQNGGFRNSQGGPKYIQNRLKAGQTDTWNIKFNKGQMARVAVRGEPGSEFSIVVNNHHGDKRSSDKGQTPQAVWMPHQKDGVDYVIKVHNRGGKTAFYQLFTN